MFWRAGPRGDLTLLMLGMLLAAPVAAFAQGAPVDDDETEVETLVVQATRTGRQVQAEPIHVEVVGAEEISEKIQMAPGNIAMLVNETGGVRLQVTSPALGAARIRVQGMPGRYTQLLADGLPLYGGQTSSFSLLQTPPSDLGQVEVIKGAASALYGPSALGGVINLVSRRPGDDAQAETLLNVTSRGGQDVTGYLSSPLGAAWGASLVGGLNRQTRQDLDGDGWIDMPAYDRWSLRPRLFWTGDAGARAFLTLGAMGEQRSGGTAPGRVAPDGRPFLQDQDTRRLDAGVVAEAPLAVGITAQLRASAMSERDDRRFGSALQNDRQGTLFAEASVAGRSGDTTWLAGVAAQEDRFRSLAAPAFNYTYRVPALFLQAEHDVGDALTIAASARYDAHNVYGDHVSPRLSLLYRPGPWKVRASVGQGFYAPTPFVEEIEAAGLSRLQRPGRLRAETATTASLEGGYAEGPFETYLTLFGSDVDHAVRLETAGRESVRLVNVQGVTRTRGAEAMFRYRIGEFTLNGSYVYVDAHEPGESGGRRAVPLTPRHSGGLDLMWERPGRGRIGAEAYYTGRQPLEDNPYRTEGEPYLLIGLMGELVVGRARLFLNLENVLDERQVRRDPLLLPRRSPAGAWTVDAWGPTEGFIANAGVRLVLGDD